MIKSVQANFTFFKTTKHFLLFFNAFDFDEGATIKTEPSIPAKEHLVKGGSMGTKHRMSR